MFRTLLRTPEFLHGAAMSDIDKSKNVIPTGAKIKMKAAACTRLKTIARHVTLRCNGKLINGCVDLAASIAIRCSKNF